MGWLLSRSRPSCLAIVLPIREWKMPLYDCVLLLKPRVKRELIIDLVARIGKHVLSRNGVITEVKSFGPIQLGYGIKKLDGRFYQAHLMQMTMMATPNMNKELHYLNKEDRLLRWLLKKHRNTVYLQDDHTSEDSWGTRLRRDSRGGILSFLDDNARDEDDDTEDEDDNVSQYENKPPR